MAVSLALICLALLFTMCVETFVTFACHHVGVATGHFAFTNQPNVALLTSCSKDTWLRISLTDRLPCPSCEALYQKPWSSAPTGNVSTPQQPQTQSPSSTGTPHLPPQYPGPSLFPEPLHIGPTNISRTETFKELNEWQLQFKSQAQRENQRLEHLEEQNPRLKRLPGRGRSRVRKSDLSCISVRDVTPYRPGITLNNDRNESDAGSRNNSRAPNSRTALDQATISSGESCHTLAAKSDTLENEKEHGKGAKTAQQLADESWAGITADDLLDPCPTDDIAAMEKWLIQRAAQEKERANYWEFWLLNHPEERTALMKGQQNQKHQRGRRDNSTSNRGESRSSSRDMHFGLRGRSHQSRPASIHSQNSVSLPVQFKFPQAGTKPSNTNLKFGNKSTVRSSGKQRDESVASNASTCSVGSLQYGRDWQAGESAKKIKPVCVELNGDLEKKNQTGTLDKQAKTFGEQEIEKQIHSKAKNEKPMTSQHKSEKQESTKSPRSREEWHGLDRRAKESRPDSPNQECQGEEKIDLEADRRQATLSLQFFNEPANAHHPNATRVFGVNNGHLMKKTGDYALREYFRQRKHESARDYSRALHGGSSDKMNSSKFEYHLNTHHDSEGDTSQLGDSKKTKHIKSQWQTESVPVHAMNPPRKRSATWSVLPDCDPFFKDRGGLKGPIVHKLAESSKNWNSTVVLEPKSNNPIEEKLALIDRLGNEMSTSFHGKGWKMKN